MTIPTRMVLRTALAQDGEWYGYQISEAVGLPPGTVYPILARLEEHGLLSSRWEEIDQRAEGRPRRRYYQLTPEGVERARTARPIRLELNP